MLITRTLLIVFVMMIAAAQSCSAFVRSLQNPVIHRRRCHKKIMSINSISSHSSKPLRPLVGESSDDINVKLVVCGINLCKRAL
jgi:hypothetical protein